MSLKKQSSQNLRWHFGPEGIVLGGWPFHSFYYSRLMSTTNCRIETRMVNYNVITVNDLGTEGAASSSASATTLPADLVDLDVSVDTAAGTITVSMTNHWGISGYQFHIGLSSSKAAISS